MRVCAIRIFIESLCNSQADFWSVSSWKCKLWQVSNIYKIYYDLSSEHWLCVEAYACICTGVCVCVYIVCVWERERENMCVCVCEKETELDTDKEKRKKKREHSHEENRQTPAFLFVFTVYISAVVSARTLSPRQTFIDHADMYKSNTHVHTCTQRVYWTHEADHR